jgi:hypothetical protein
VKVGTIKRAPAEEGFSNISPDEVEEAGKPVAKPEPKIEVEAEMNEMVHHETRRI